MLAVLFGLLTALCLAASHVLMRRGLEVTNTPFTGTVVNLAVNAAFLWALSLFLVPATAFASMPWLVFVTIGIFVPSLARASHYRGVSLVGVSRSTAMLGTSPLFSTLAAVAFLGERPTGYVLVAIPFIITGVALLSWMEEQGRWRGGGILYSLVAALLFSGRDALGRFGLLRFAYPLAGATVVATTSSLVMLAAALLFRPGTLPFRNPYFFASGITAGLSYLFLYSGLHAGQVVVVAPFVYSHPAFVVGMTALFLRKFERLSGRILVGVGLILAGMLLVVISEAWRA